MDYNIYEGVELNLDFKKGHGDDLPDIPGIIAEMHWPTNSICIREGASMRKLSLDHMNWADKHKAGTHKGEKASRQGPIVDLAKEWGSEGLEYFVVSDNFRFFNKSLRESCKMHLVEWVRTQTTYRNMNG